MKTANCSISLALNVTLCFKCLCMGFLIRVLFIFCTVSAIAQISVSNSASNSNGSAGNSNGPLFAVSGYALDDRHILEPGDEISFQILEDKKPATNLLVADSSELSIPYIGRVSVVGKTCRQLAGGLKVLLERDYYYRATVVIGLNVVNKVCGQVLVWGEVRNQGAIDILSGHPLTVGEAILRAGGLTEDADKKKVKVVRHRGGPAQKVFEVNMADVVEDGETEKDLIVEPGDYIIVKPRAIKF
ncbi:MAG TPA: polysaccharide biosynthesis/export family protein [Verrucomicrobiae bacterium]|nr:polysaccharide biosynthesis/export family protein [Verrucomicrobiae bacterium]